MAFRGLSFCVLRFRISPSFPIGCWGGVPDAKNIRKFGRDPPKYGGLAKFRRSVKFRGVPRCVILRSVVSYPLPNWALGKGVSSARKIRKFGRNPPKYGGFQGGLAKFRLSVTFRGVPRCTAAPLYLFGSFAFPLTQLSVGTGWCPARKILGNLGEIRQNMADSRAVWLNLGVPSRSLAFRGAPRCPAVSLFCSVFTYCPPPPTWCWKSGIRISEIFFKIRDESAKIWRTPGPCI